MTPSNWTGMWYGEIAAYPEGAPGNGWNVTMRIVLYPRTVNSCTTWSSIFTEHSVVKLTKDYRFCRGPGAEDFYIDEGTSKAAGRRIHNIFVSGMKVDGLHATVTLRMRGGVLVEEIVMTDDPVVENKSILVSALPRTLNVKTLRRQRHHET